MMMDDKKKFSKTTSRSRNVSKNINIKQIISNVIKLNGL